MSHQISLFYAPLRVTHYSHYIKAYKSIRETRFMVLYSLLAYLVQLFKFCMNKIACNPQSSMINYLPPPPKKECEVILLFIARVHIHSSCMTLIGVHEMHLLVVNLCSSLAYFMMTHPLPIAGKLPIE